MRIPLIDLDLDYNTIDFAYWRKTQAPPVWDEYDDEYTITLTLHPTLLNITVF